MEIPISQNWGKNSFRNSAKTAWVYLSGIQSAGYTHTGREYYARYDAASARQKEIQKRCSELLRILGIEEVKDKYPYQVSGGQKQRCACARALANHPTLLLADEPTGALDSLSAQTLLETFTDMNQNMGATILMVTHDAFSASYCSRILFLKDGKIFHELVRGGKERRAFLNEILDVMTLTGGERSHDV